MARLVTGNVALKTQTGMDFLTDSQMDHAIFLGRCKQIQLSVGNEMRKNSRTIVLPYQILDKRTQTVMA